MNKKSYTVLIRIDFNTIDCPGVWLCPKGKAFMKVCLFGIAELTRDVDPFFPLTIRERFIFEKEFRDISSVYELHDKIGRSVISIELLQCPVGSPACVKLAIFNSLLADLLHPYSSCFSRPPDTSGIELLFTTCKIFPGIIAPKADVALKVSVSDARGDGSRPTVRRMPLKPRKGDMKRQQAVCHSKNGLRCGCFSHQRAQPDQPDQSDSGEAGDGVRNEQSASQGRKTEYRPPSDGVQNEPRAFQGRKTEYRPLADGVQNEPRAFQDRKPANNYRRPPPEPTPYSYKDQTRQAPPQTLTKSTRAREGNRSKFQRQDQQPEYEDEPDMEWARINLGVAVGPGEYKRDGTEQKTLFSQGWEYVWDGDNKGKRQTILSTRRGRFRATQNPGDKKQQTNGGRNDGEVVEIYGEDAIKRQMEECEKLMKDYTPEDLKNDPELKTRYEECVSNIEWLKNYSEQPPEDSSEKLYDEKPPEDSSENLIPSTDTEEPLQAMTQRQRFNVPCHGKCCKCEDQQVNVGQIEREGQSYQKRWTRDRTKLSPIDENKEWFPRKTREKEQQQEVRRKKESVWERERITHEQEQTRRITQGDEDQERRRQERERRREQERIRQRQQRERMKRQVHESSSDAEPEELNDPAPVGELDRTIRPWFAQTEDPPPRRRVSPDRAPKKPNGGKTRPLEIITRPSTIPVPVTKKPPQQPKSSETRKPQSVPAKQPDQPPPGKKPQDDPPRDEAGDSPGEDCDCDLCEQYQKLYNPSSHPCPRFRKNGKPPNSKQRNAGAGAKKLISSRKNGQGKSTNGPKTRGRKDGECGFYSCDGPIDTEAIEEMNAIQKFYYGK